MQVTQLDDQITHAVAGGQKVQSFGIAQTAEFFQVLSSSLYSNKKLAVVRETLCNAWDAHIEGGVTNLPIKVTLNDKKLIIKDSGPGIHTDDVPYTYCTYGGTTKIMNENVTGGFGLGCKAPFAYTDHFEVVSCHEHVKTVYQMSLSSAKVGGLPSMTEILSIPTTETGLTVTIDLNDRHDREDFGRLIKMIASFGQMNLELNGVPVKTIPFDTAEHGFLIVQGQLIKDNTSPLCVRYGNVVYPFGVHDDYRSVYDQCTRLLQKLLDRYDPYNRNSGSKTWTTVLQAPPNSISVTPSRESISITDHTVATLKKLMEEFLFFMQGVDYDKEIMRLGKERIKAAGLLYAPQELLKLDKMPRHAHDMATANETRYLATAKDLALHTFRMNYPDIKNFQTQDFIWRVGQLKGLGFNNRNIAHSMSVDIRKGKARTKWFHLKYLWPIIKDMKKTNHSRLFLYMGSLTEATKVKRIQSIDKYIGLLRDIVIIAHTKDDIDRANSLPVIQHWIGSLARGCLFYRVARSPKKIEAAIKHFESLGMNVLDLTVPLPWETPIVVAPVQRAAPTVTRQKGIPLLKDCLMGGKFSIHKAYDPHNNRIENPEFVIMMSPRKDDIHSFGRFRQDACAAITRLYGDKGGIARGYDHFKTYADKGAKDIEEWIYAQLKIEFDTNKNLGPFFKNSVKHRRQLIGHDLQMCFDMIMADEVLRKKFGITYVPTDREKSIYTIWSNFDEYRIKYDDTLKGIKKIIDSWNLEPKIQALIDIIEKSEYIKLISVHQAQSMLRGTSVTPAALELKNKVRKTILTLLKD